jgi:hypothetical protein
MRSLPACCEVPASPPAPFSPAPGKTVPCFAPTVASEVDALVGRLAGSVMQRQRDQQPELPWLQQMSLQLERIFSLLTLQEDPFSGGPEEARSRDKEPCKLQINVLT